MRKSWFQKGVKAFQEAFPGSPQLYVCPLCARGFSVEALDAKWLTLEHAPPESLGGSAVCLTCKGCNNSSGYTLDAQMRKRENLIEFARGEMTEFRPARFEIGQATVNVYYYHGGGGILVTGLPGNNASLSQSEFERELDDQCQAKPRDLRFRITPYLDRYESQLEHVGWLRCAYLVSFAAFGYLYIYQRRLEPVRHQLDEPHRNVLECFSATIPDAVPDESKFLLVEEPSQLRGIAIQMGRHLVFLPWLMDDLYERIQEERNSKKHFQADMKGQLLLWPKHPMHLLDFNLATGVHITRSREG